MISEWALQQCSATALPVTASPCQILSKLVKPRPKYGDFSIFQDGGRRHLEFQNFKSLMVGRLKRAEVRRHAKFGPNRSKLGRDMAIFVDFFKDCDRRYFGFSALLSCL